MPAWTVEVIDKQTGSEFQLRMEGLSADSCAPRLFELGFVVGRCRPAPELKPDPAYREHAEFLRKLGYGEDSLVKPTGALFKAWTSDDLATMENALQWESHPIDRHFVLQRMVRLAYTIGNPAGASKIKKNSTTLPVDAWRMVEPFGWQWIIESPAFLPLIMSERLGICVCDDLRKHLKARGFRERAEFVAAIEAAFCGDSEDE